MPESRVARADRRSASLLDRIGMDLRAARCAAGLSLVDVAVAVGISKSEISRIERGSARWASVWTLYRVASVVGLDLWMRLYPGADPLRDAGQARLEATFRGMLGPGLRVAAEVPVGDPSDLRAWDLVVTDRLGKRAAVELDTRLTDGQAYLRRIHLKRRDGDVDRLILVLLDTRANRAAVAAMRPVMGDAIEIGQAAARTALAALRVGRLPDRDVLILLRPAARRP